MSKNTQKRIIDVTGIELTPGEPAICLGNGEQGLEYCCDECDCFLFCFPEFDPKREEDIATDNDNRAKQTEKGQRM